MKAPQINKCCTKKIKAIPEIKKLTAHFSLKLKFKETYFFFPTKEK